MESKISNEEQTWIDAGVNNEEKAFRKDAILNLIEMNGLKFEPGIGKSYIPEKNYYQFFVDNTKPASVCALIQNALNWDALGRGIGGLAGTGVRAGIANLIDNRRETRVVTVLTPEIEAIVKEYNTFVSNKKEIFPFWLAQAQNVLGLAGAIFNREMHHWNADNTKPQAALLGALNQTDSIPEGEYRKLFYLSIHPVPLNEMERLRSLIAAGKVPGINDAVSSRCRSAPASCGDIHACAQAIPDLQSETYFRDFGTQIKDDLVSLITLNKAILKDAGAYHSFAANYGVNRILVDKLHFKRAMTCLCAYIIVNVKGSLANSAALKKFRSNNSRNVQKWISAFETAQADAAETLAHLTANPS